MSDIAGTVFASYLLLCPLGGGVMNPVESVWYEGFFAGEKYLQECPYHSASNEANIWHAGWVEGMLKSHGCTYRDKPSGLEENELMKGLIRW